MKIVLRAQVNERLIEFRKKNVVIHKSERQKSNHRKKFVKRKKVEKKKKLLGQGESRIEIL